MEKAIDLQVAVPLDASTRDVGPTVQQALADAFAKANPKLQLTIRDVSAPDAAGNVTVDAHIEGNVPAPTDFEALATAALNAALPALPATRDLAAAPPEVREIENEDEDVGLVTPAQVPSL